ncbi:MAG: hypothetical protein KGZ37_07750 [Nitrosarchaeum sp.]|nr:hypothetical protein [Nitrosarchaeum sp.]
MKKSVSLVIISVVIVVGLIFVSLSISNPNEEKSLSDEKEIPNNPVVEPKNYILKLEDSVSTSLQP